MEILYPRNENELIDIYNNRIAESSKILQILMGSFVSISPFVDKVEEIAPNEDEKQSCHFPFPP